MHSPEELAQSIQRYEQYAQADPGNVLLQINLGDLHHEAGHFADAIACYERCLAREPENKTARSRLASVMISQHRFQEAEKTLRGVISGGQPDPVLLHNLGLTLYYQTRWSDARQCFADAAASGLNVPDNFAYLAKTLHHLGSMREAIDACQRWVDLARDLSSKSYMALLHMDANDVATGRAFAVEVLRENPDDVDANVVAGAYSMERQAADEARTYFETALRLDRENGRAWLGLGLVHLYDREHDKAIDALENAARIYPDNPGIVVTLGWAKLIAKDAIGAERVFEQALRVDRNFSESHGGLAAALAFQGKLDRAQGEINLAKRLDPKSFGADIARTAVLAAQGSQQAATDVFARMLERSPQSGVAPLIEQLKIYAARKPFGPVKPHAGKS